MRGYFSFSTTKEKGPNLGSGSLWVKISNLTSLLVIPIHPLVLSLAMTALLPPFAAWSELCLVLSGWRRLLEPTGPDWSTKESSFAWKDPGAS